MSFSERAVSVELTYETVTKVRRLLVENGMSLICHDGANLLSCLVPTIINSSAELTGNAAGYRGNKIVDAILSFDANAASILPSVAAVSVIVAEAP